MGMHFWYYAFHGVTGGIEAGGEIRSSMVKGNAICVLMAQGFVIDFNAVNSRTADMKAPAKGCFGFIP